MWKMTNFYPPSRFGYNFQRVYHLLRSRLKLKMSRIMNCVEVIADIWDRSIEERRCVAPHPEP